MVRGRDLLAVEPDVGAEVDAVETQPERLAAILRGQLEIGAEPPRFAERAVGRHGRIREVEAYVVADARRGAQIRSEVRVGVDTRRDQGAEDGGGQGGRSEEHTSELQSPC